MVRCKVYQIIVVTVQVGLSDLIEKGYKEPVCNAPIDDDIVDRGSITSYNSTMIVGAYCGGVKQIRRALYVRVSLMFLPGACIPADKVA
jgi:hypothetical protein